MKQLGKPIMNYAHSIEIAFFDSQDWTFSTNTLTIEWMHNDIEAIMIEVFLTKQLTWT